LIFAFRWIPCHHLKVRPEMKGSVKPTLNREWTQSKCGGSIRASPLPQALALPYIPFFIHKQWRRKVFGQDMQFLPTATGDSLGGKATMWQAAKLWQDETVVVTSFGLQHIHDLIETYASKNGTASTPHLLAYYCRKIHQPCAPPLFCAVESREIPTQADLLIHHVHGPVAYFLVHKDDKRVAELFTADVYNTLLAYTNSALKPERVYQLGCPVGSTSGGCQC
jgi:hypothetical protein